MAKRLPTILLICLVFAVAWLARQVMTLETSIAELREEIELSRNSMPVVRAPDRELRFDYDSAIRLWQNQGERIVPINDPSIERAMQMDRLQRRVIRERTQPEVRPIPEPSRLEGEELKQFIDLLPESEK